MHSAICETYLVYWCCIDLWSIGGGYICLQYMYILLYVKLLWCSGFSRDLCLIGGGGRVSLPWVYVHSAICETYLV